jgi:ADP-ribose pyrophosphatase YjhB (NUDIX family)
MYKVFVYGKPLYLTDDLSFFQHIPHENRGIYTKAENLEKLIKKIRLNKSIEEFILYSFDLNEMWHSFTSLFTVIDAAGGIIRNKKGDLLFIFRKGKWDLPKGKVDPGETIAEGAVREVKEECGLREVILGKLLAKTYHTYTEGNKRILKITYWYGMEVPGTQKLVPQAEEDITDIKWIRADKLAEVRNNTYRSVADLLDEFVETVHEG